MPEITLIPWHDHEADVLAIEVSDAQLPFINGTVAHFLADDDEHPTFESFAVCDGETVVGVVCYGHEVGDEASRWWIPLVAIDQRYQGRGYGRATMEALLHAIRAAAPDSQVLGLSCKPDNLVAMHLYRSLGFEAGQRNARGGIDMWLTLDRTRPQ